MGSSISINMKEGINKISSFVDSWWKIIIVISTIVAFIYEISVLHITIQETKAQQEIHQIHTQEELNTRDERTTKRYDRGIDIFKKLKQGQDKLESELEKHLIEDAYKRGLNDIYRKLY